MRGVLLVNLGSPSTPHLSSVYRYLNEFLTDPRVIDLPWLQRHLLVKGVIVPLRLKRVTSFYKTIWMQEGAPLQVYGDRLLHALREALGPSYRVELAMRYPAASIKEALDRLMEVNLKELIVLPLFPQYASATTGSILEKTMEYLSEHLVIPPLRTLGPFESYPPFIKCLADNASSFNLSSYDHILMSFHGLPERQLKKADRGGRCLKEPGCCENRITQTCYAAQCHATGSALADKLSLPKSRYSISFQSRLGKEPWIGPCTEHVLKNLAAKKAKVLVFSPSFVADCIETMYEIGVEYKNLFLSHGGETLDWVPSLNDNPQWVSALKSMIMEKSHGD